MNAQFTIYDVFAQKRPIFDLKIQDGRRSIYHHFEGEGH